jgi:DNA-binding CsgD family transcriptional regulator
MGEPTRDALAIVEASYRIGDSTEGWLAQILAAFSAAIGAEARGVATLYDATRPDRVEITSTVNRDLPPGFVHELFHQPVFSPGAAEPLVAIFRRGVFGTVSQLIWPFVPAYRELFQRFQIEDLTGIVTTDPSFRGCMLAVPTAARSYSSRTLYLWRKLSAHLAAGLRLQRLLTPLLQTRPDPTDHAEAVLTTGREIAHAVGDAATASGREVLRRALVRIDGARAVRDTDEEQAIDLWGGLVAGRWSLVEHFERDGRRYFLAYRNDPAVAKVRALTPRERQVWSYAATGHTNRLIAYNLGLSVPTVAKHLARARGKMGGRVTLDALRALLPNK